MSTDHYRTMLKIFCPNQHLKWEWRTLNTLLGGQFAFFRNQICKGKAVPANHCIEETYIQHGSTIIGRTVEADTLVREAMLIFSRLLQKNPSYSLELAGIGGSTCKNFNNNNNNNKAQLCVWGTGRRTDAQKVKLPKVFHCGVDIGTRVKVGIGRHL